MKYILLTSAYNEKKYITETIKCILLQTCLPKQWIIISDGSTDGTDEILKDYAGKHNFITYVRFQNPVIITSELGRTSKRVVACIQKGLEYVNCNDYQFIGNIDADTSIEPGFFNKLLYQFLIRDKLGLGGGYIYNRAGNRLWSYFTNPEQVGGPLQLFRRECWDQIGGYYPGGHHDYFAVVNCKMHGWEVRSFGNLKVIHHKNIATECKNELKAKFHLGQMDHVCGELFLYSLARSLSIINKKPILIGSILRITGYLFAFITRKPKQIPMDLKIYSRREQINKLFKIIFRK